MNLSLKTKALALVAGSIVLLGVVSTALTIQAQRKSIDREVAIRGIALSKALSRAVDEGLAAENLNLIKQVQDIVHTNDVILTQIFSTLWHGVTSVPVDQLNAPPSAGATEYFKTHKGENEYYVEEGSAWIDFYSPVFLDPNDARVPIILIGFIRIRISSEQIDRTIAETIFKNIVAAALITVTAILLLNAIIGRYLLRPILELHRSMTRHKQGELPNIVPVRTKDEIGELSAEFNQMSRALRDREERIAEEKERLAVTLRSIGDGVIVTDITGMVTLINNMAEQHTGWLAQEALGKHLSEVFPIINERTRKPCENPVEKVLQTGLISGLANHTALIRRDGTEIIIEDSAAPIRDHASRIVGIVLVFRDTTEKRRMEEELLKVEKLESVGLLAGGIAHDFNNLLTTIIGNISMAKIYLDGHGKAYERLTEAEKATRRATELTYQLLTFSKGGAPVKKTESIVDIVRESVGFALSGTKVSALWEISEEVSNVDVDAGQMSQVFNNLTINAVHAMPNGGVILIGISNIVIADKEFPSLSQGAYVKMSFRDTGTGIPEEHLSKIFDPYFTTKQKGSGLGLASAYSVVKKHGGHIIAESKQGEGATFHVLVPASQGKAAAIPADGQGIVRGQGKVLVMDDEELVREIAGELLRTLGYNVSFARNGAEAIMAYQAALDEKNIFDVVILDLTIPGGMGGKETIGQLRMIDHEITAIVSSGYSNDPIMADYESFGFKGVITKPYDIVQLDKTLHAVLKGRASVKNFIKSRD